MEFFTEKKNGPGWKLRSTQRKNIREWINEGKIKSSNFIMLNWSNNNNWLAIIIAKIKLVIIAYGCMKWMTVMS